MINDRNQDSRKRKQLTSFLYVNVNSVQHNMSCTTIIEERMFVFGCDFYPYLRCKIEDENCSFLNDYSLLVEG